MKKRCNRKLNKRFFKIKQKSMKTSFFFSGVKEKLQKNKPKKNIRYILRSREVNYQILPLSFPFFFFFFFFLNHKNCLLKRTKNLDLSAIFFCAI